MERPANAQPIDIDKATNRSNNQLNMANFFKAFENENNKYRRFTMDNFNQRFKLFLERCDKADILVKVKNEAFLIMLFGHVLQYY